ncbi:cysteine desulfurase, partial [bacterium]|nr:cysteine desulfurase [bacterium]
DSAATCLTPKHIADAMFHYQCFSHANSHKGLYQLSANVTEKVEHARTTVADFLGAEHANSIVFNSGTTEALNLVAYSFVEPLLIKAKLDNNSDQKNIVISAAEHHANLLPWQRLAQQYQAELRVASIDESGQIDLLSLAGLLDHNTVVLAFTHCSNVLGQFNPASKICRLARSKNIATIIDGAQAVAHGPVNVKEIDCDFYAFSGHKLYGPTGCGVLYGKGDIFEQMRPYQLGGGMITSVDFNKTNYLSGPLKFEPGSHNVASIVGLVEAIDYLHYITWPEINKYIDNLSHYLFKSLAELNYFKPVIERKILESKFKKNKRPSLYSFQIEGVHSHDVAGLLDSENIAVRAGHHCAQPLHQALDINASIRVSLGIYNDYSDVDKLINGLSQAHRLMAIR